MTITKDFKSLIKEGREFLTMEGYAEDEKIVDKAQKIVPFFYFLIFFVAFQRLEGLTDAITRGHPEIFLPRWPIFWANYFDYATAVTIITLALLFGTLLGAILYRHWLGRAAAFIVIFEQHAFMSSFRYPSHQWDVWLWIALILVFLPDIWNKKSSPEENGKFLLLFWCAQAFLLLTYSMSGFLKAVSGINQLLLGEANLFQIDSAALQIANLLQVKQEASVLGPLIINYQFIGWVGLIFFVYLELFSFLAAFKPILHRIWAVGLIFFHLGTYLAMNAIFVAPIVPLAVFLLDSPFSKSYKFKDTLYELPIFGWLIRVATGKS